MQQHLTFVAKLVLEYNYKTAKDARFFILWGRDNWRKLSYIGVAGVENSFDIS